MTKKLATFKYAPSKSLPARPGPVQCVRNCTNCVLNRNFDDADTEAEDIIAIRSYDDLVKRRSLWILRYQTIQYHLGQIDVLKQSFRAIKPSLVIYVVATTRKNDLNYFHDLLRHERLPRAILKTGNINLSCLQADQRASHVLIPTRIISCFTEMESERDLLEAKELRRVLEPVVDKVNGLGYDTKAVIVPVSISKDHDKSTLFGIGTICIQVMQPYLVTEYLMNARAIDKTIHLVQHLYHDLTRYGPRLPCHIVALLLVYLDRPMGVSRDDLVEYTDWMRKSAMELDLHLAFTGNTDEAIDFALLILEDYVQHDTSELVYRPKNHDALKYYASTLIPNMTYYGLISKAILMLHNKEASNDLITRFCPNVRVKVMRDDLLDLVQDMAKQLDNLIPCRKPCVDIRTSIMASFNSMMTYGKYFTVREAHARQRKGLGWLGDYDSDEEYFMSKRDNPAFKPWILLTKRPYRLDRLNLLMNIVEAYLEYILSEDGDARDETRQE